ncbi:GNAT family N-acetyltransferase [Methylobacterium currus]|uniref:GNAT family N-acetyltransferase n=1 Tax=Methylobacterium currus TaxID=2051553 RepID=A0A2R4WF14_9HYPH|nr:GNAT family N-acetyltransferase [Methylobacterium currus]AWB20099.1 GNAT family N-acetyltransferase [Methylobacterium currus]UHC15162.1 GNAT family N-acetyltransferase [Methylobacterium currus]
MTPGFSIGPLDDLPAVLSLNAAHVAETSHLDEAALRALADQAFLATTITTPEGLAAFLIALDQDARYASPNFRWFQARYPRFVYVDRIVTAPAQRGRGLARALYGDLFARAAAAGHDRVACEVNRVPPNPGSDAFHAALGFEEVGTAQIHGGAKTVRYLLRGAVR